LGAGRAPAERQLLFLVLAVAAMVSLVQVPYPHGVYLLYAAPAIVLAVVYLAAMQERRTAPLHACFFAFYFLFAVVWIRGGLAPTFGARYLPCEQDHLLHIERGGLLVDADVATVYNPLIPEIQTRTGPDDFIYAAPDCPEVYFFSGRKNPTRTFYDCFDDDYQQPERNKRILDLLDQRGIDVVVLRGLTQFSQGLPPDLRRQIAARYPNDFCFRMPGAAAPLIELRWRDGKVRPQASARPRAYGGLAQGRPSGLRDSRPAFPGR